jgi:hypothetical protein
MTDGEPITVNIQERVHLVGPEPMEAAHPATEGFLARVAHHTVELGAVTGREDDRLFHAGLLQEAAERGDDNVWPEGHALADRDWRGFVVYTEG